MEASLEKFPNFQLSSLYSFLVRFARQTDRRPAVSSRTAITVVGWYIFLRGPVLPCKPNKEARTSGHTRRMHDHGERNTHEDRRGERVFPAAWTSVREGDEPKRDRCGPRAFHFEPRTIKGFRRSDVEERFHEAEAGRQTNEAGIFSFITRPERFTSRKPLLIGRSRFFFFLLDQQTSGVSPLLQAPCCFLDFFFGCCAKKSRLPAGYLGPPFPHGDFPLSKHLHAEYMK